MVVITFEDGRRSRRRKLLRSLAAIVGIAPRQSRKRRPALHGLNEYLKRDIGLSP